MEEKIAKKFFLLRSSEGARTSSFTSAVTLTAICFVLMIFFVPLSSFGAEKLIVKNSSNATTFSVDENGTVLGFQGLFGNYATPARSIRALNLIGDTGSMRLWRVHDLYPPTMEFLYSTTGSPDTVLNYWDVFAGPAFGSSNMFAIRDRISNKVRLSIQGNGYVGIGMDTTLATHLLQLSGGAYSDGLQWYPASSRKYKENIKELGTEEAMETVAALNPVKYNYKTDKEQNHVGFIAEDVPDLVALKDRKALSPMDIVAVLTKVVQEQQKTISELTDKVNSLEGKVSKINHRDALSSARTE